MSKQVLEKHSGKVPKTFEELEKLPGVGHKTASVSNVSRFWISRLLQLILTFIDLHNDGV
jgi:endonuclease III